MTEPIDPEQDPEQDNIADETAPVAGSLETADPIASLAASGIHVRAAAARDLSKIGTPAVIPLLVKMAQHDKSPAIRLGTAGAAADILSRYRVGKARATLSSARRLQLLDLFKGIDPGINSGLFSMLACLDLPDSLRRIAAGLRDPRGGVRVGAAVGLLRLCASVSAMGDAALEEQVVALLGDHRLKPDALAEVCRVCAAVGFTSARAIVEDLDLGGTHGEVANLARSYFRAADMPLTGAWVSDGRDAGEVNPTPALPPALLVVVGGGAIIREGEAWRLEDGLFDRPHRRMFVRRAGEHKWGPALQLPGRTFYEVSDDALFDAVDAGIDPSTLDWANPIASWEHAGLLADAVLPRLSDTGPANRTRAVLLAAAGRLDEAVVALETAVGQKKTPADTWFFLGEVLAARGQTERARECWEAAGHKAKRKKDWFAARARERLG